MVCLLPRPGITVGVGQYSQRSMTASCLIDRRATDGRRSRVRVMAADWHDIPRDHYAIPVVDDATSADWATKLFERKCRVPTRPARRSAADGWHGWHGWRCTYLMPTAAMGTNSSGRSKKTTTHYNPCVGHRPSCSTPSTNCRAVFGAVTGRCGCCGRTLTDPDSRMRGIGPECAKGKLRPGAHRRGGSAGRAFPVLAVFRLGSRYEEATTAGGCSYAGRRACRAIIPT